jgi:hypothetical protein
MLSDDIKRLREAAEAAYDNTSANAAYIAAASPDVLLALLERLEVAERERDEARDCCARAGGVMRHLRDERNVLAALLRDARGAIDIAGYGSQMAPEVRSVIERIEAAPPAPGCIDPLCPCQDGALCHYVDGPDGTMALPLPSAEPVADDCTPNHLCGGRWVHKPSDETCNRCGHE